MTINNKNKNMQADIKTITESNRDAWNQALKYHQKARADELHIGFKNPDFTTFDRDCDHVLIKKLEEIDFSGKTIGQLPCNNGRELLSLMKRGAKKAIGFDIADIAVNEAKELAEISGLDATFKRTNILDISSEYDNLFDFIYISEGSLQWFPDLKEYFSVVSRLLKKNGTVLIFEMHPFAYFFEGGFDINYNNFDDIISYFSTKPHGYKTGLDYVGGVEYESEECYWFMHKFSDIIKALITNRIDILDIEEYNMEMANNKSAKIMQNFPLSYILTGKKQ